jgi:hypothetical protein
MVLLLGILLIYRFVVTVQGSLKLYISVSSILNQLRTPGYLSQIDAALGSFPLAARQAALPGWF